MIVQVCPSDTRWIIIFPASPHPQTIQTIQTIQRTSGYALQRAEDQEWHASSRKIRRGGCWQHPADWSSKVLDRCQRDLLIFSFRSFCNQIFKECWCIREVYRTLLVSERGHSPEIIWDPWAMKAGQMRNELPLGKGDSWKFMEILFKPWLWWFWTVSVSQKNLQVVNNTFDGFASFSIVASFHKCLEEVTEIRFRKRAKLQSVVSPHFAQRMGFWMFWMFWVAFVPLKSRGWQQPC